MPATGGPVDSQAAGSPVPEATQNLHTVRDVFISYASQDAAVAAAVVRALERSGIACWIAPRDVTPGTFYGDEIVHAIDAAKASVLILSQNAAASQHVLREVERAASKRHPVVSLRIDQVPLPAGLEYFLNTSQWLDANGGDIARSLPKLTAAVRIAIQAPANTLANPPEPRTPEPSAGSPKRRAIVVVALIGIIIVGFAADRLWVLSRRAEHASLTALTGPPLPSAPVTPAISEKSVAVLPFVDMSEKKDQEYFSDGLSEELIDLLTQIPDLQVIARTSSFYFKGKQATIPEIAKTLGVANILEGSVRKSGTTLRVTAQLIRADTGVHLWSKTYDRDEKDIFKVQDDLAASVVDALKAKLLPARPLASARRTGNSEAYEQYLIGKQAYNRDAYAEAVPAYRRAVSLDANFGAAYAGLAEAEADLADSVTGERAALKRAMVAADRAVALAPDQPEGYAARGWLRFAFYWDWNGGRADIEKAMGYGPGNSTVQIRDSELLNGLGHLPEAIKAAKQAVEADPLSANAWKALGEWLTNDRQFPAARQALGRAIELSPENLLPRWYLSRLEVITGHPTEALAHAPTDAPDAGLFITAVAMYSRGHYAESKKALDEMIAHHAATLAFQVVEAYAWRSESDKAFEWLDRSYSQHDSGLLWIKTDPFLSSIRADARFAAMLQKLNLPQQQ